ncbi:Methyltransferase domain-containing protein [Desulfonatronum zhilinae]|nr:Methyltransferase domain-containing protein [Desulfonatronum zhilinae]
MKQSIHKEYSKYYLDKNPSKVYPTEFVVRIFLANYPCLSFNRPKPNDKVLDIGFGDGRNTVFLCDLGLDVHGVEISDDIVQHANNRLTTLGHRASLCVGRNTNIPYPENSFDYILACHSCYYCDGDELFIDNLKEYARVLKVNGYLVASVPDNKSYIFQGASKLQDGSYKIQHDPYGNRVGYRLQAFESVEDIRTTFSPLFSNFSFGHAKNDYFGIDERVFWVVCQKTAN